MKKTVQPGSLIGPHGVVGTRVMWAASFFSRLRGVLGRPPLRDHEALVIGPCRRVHTFGVTYPIDAVFCDSRFVVMHVETVTPRSLSQRVAGARWCIELAGGRAAASGIVAGTALSFGSSA
jgi:uncharacterized membrane protein (UPF0127 family)